MDGRLCCLIALGIVSSAGNRLLSLSSVRNANDYFAQILISLRLCPCAASISNNSFQCPDSFCPYLDLSCITFVAEPRNFSHAVNYADNLNGSLLVINEQDLTYVTRYLDTVFVSGTQLWVNASDEGGNCTSLNGIVISATPCSTELPFLVVISYHGELFYCAIWRNVV